MKNDLDEIAEFNECSGVIKTYKEPGCSEDSFMVEFTPPLPKIEANVSGAGISLEILNRHSLKKGDHVKAIFGVGRSFGSTAHVIAITFVAPRP